MMNKSHQIKLGPELLNPSQESWLAYYIFAALSIAIPALGGLGIQSLALDGPSHILALIGLAALFLIAAGITIMCHLLGHIIDELEVIKAGQGPTPIIQEK